MLDINKIECWFLQRYISHLTTYQMIAAKNLAYVLGSFLGGWDKNKGMVLDLVTCSICSKNRQHKRKMKISPFIIFPLVIPVLQKWLYRVFEKQHYLQRVPALQAFWDFDKTVIQEVCVSGTVGCPLLMQKSPTCTYISQNPW